MAGDWIKMRANLWDDPRVARLCDMLNAKEATVVGGLYWLWSSADQHSTDGLMQGLSLASVDRKTGIKGFGKALVAVGWLEDGAAGVTIPRFGEHNGESAKTRCEGQKRKANWRARAGTPTGNQQDECPEDGGTNVPRNAGQSWDKSEAREEKRREEPKTKPQNQTQVISAVVTETTATPDPPAENTPADADQPPPPKPDPAVYAAVEALRVGLAAGTAEHERAGALWGVMAANGVRGTASHPTVVEMVRDGVTVEELRKAIAKARQSKDGPLSPPYLAAIIEDMRANPEKANGKAQAWATDDHALEAKAKELGMWPTKAASYHDLRNLVRDRIAKHAEESVR